MIAAFLESIKYVGHMWPLALIRIFVGANILSSAIERLNSGYLNHAYISEHLNLNESGIYFEVFKSLIQSQWLLMTYILISFEVVIGLSYLTGFCVRIASLLGMLLATHIYLYFDLPSSSGQFSFFLIHLLFCLLGAGRCLGLDYYFYKSRRGLLW